MRHFIVIAKESKKAYIIKYRVRKKPVYIIIVVYMTE